MRATSYTTFICRRCIYPHQEGRNVSEDLFANGICLPSGSNKTEEQQQRVIDRLLENVKMNDSIF